MFNNIAHASSIYKCGLQALPSEFNLISFSVKTIPTSMFITTSKRILGETPKIVANLRQIGKNFSVAIDSKSPSI
jgi:hypothetical protein